MDERIYWIWLSQAVAAGTDTFSRLMKKFSGAKEIYEATEADISSALGSSNHSVGALADKSLENANKTLSFCDTRGVGILLYCDKNFPEAFRGLSTAPVLLYYRGTLPDFNSECFATVVGTRSLSPYGRRNAFSIAYDLATCGAIVVSGMAKGIDGVAHAGALAAGAKTVAFLGCGINVCYPEDHLTLAREIVKSGCILTEYAPDTKPFGYNFPVRNRLLAALSAATVLVEGKERSGAAITLSIAKDLSRLVYALPGNVDSDSSRAANNSIRDGAKLITSAYDVIEELGKRYPRKISLAKAKAKIEADMDTALSQYKISCVSSGDDIFRARPQKKKAAPKPTATEAKSAPSTTPISNTEKSEPQNNDGTAEYERVASLGIDKASIRIYRKIPFENSIFIDDLVDENDSISSVLSQLNKLEVLGMIEYCSGEKVKRKK